MACAGRWPTPKLSWLGFIMMTLGLLTAAVPILLNEASVLYTFYPPLQANWAFYVGLVLVVVGSWVQGYGFYITYYRWRKQNPGVRTPLMTFGSLITMVMWQIATLGIAVEILTQLLPWSLGLLPGVDPQLNRTYFWFTGHPLVYFWLLPAYVSWYAMLPKQAGGKLFSDSLARFSFWMFLVLSTPLGLHHQFTDPGVPTIWKTIHAILTYAVAFPSLLTAFTVVASLEYAGRQRGGKGLLGWIPKLPWSNPSVSIQILSGVLFVFGGIGGITNASYNINLVIHNTAWVPGHFHLTVASAVTMTFMGIAYWLVPHLTGRNLWAPKLALAQGWIWFIGMMIFSNAMHTLGLLGAPRRTPLGVAPYVPANWEPRLLQTAIGGVDPVHRRLSLRDDHGGDGAAQAGAGRRGAGGARGRVDPGPAAHPGLAGPLGALADHRHPAGHPDVRPQPVLPDHQHAEHVAGLQALVTQRGDLKGVSSGPTRRDVWLISLAAISRASRPARAGGTPS